MNTMTAKTATLRKIKWKKILPISLMALPGVLYLIVNNYLPMFGLFIAFKDINFAKGILASDWVGLKNFEYLFKTRDAYIITRNTLLYNGAFIILTTVISIAVAILLNEIRNMFAKRFYQSVILLPFIVSMVIVSYLVFAFLSTENGLVNNYILPLLGISEIAWYMEKEYWPFILTSVHIWKQIGFSTVIYLASIVGIDPEYYDAAMIDGAGKWRQIRSITLPLLVPIIITLTLISIGRIFYSDFGLFYQVPMNSGAIYDTTNVIDTYVYRGLLQLGDIGMSSAAGLYQSLVGFILVIISNLIVRRISKENALF
jgi:putative aldouronate transport system permease protein